MTDTDFIEFPKMARLSRECVITEKIDGTNAQVFITDDGQIKFGSRTRWVTPENDNFGFARWATDNKEDLLKLGPGRHFGEWWGSGIQRGYGLPKGEKRFSLFNTIRWCKAGAVPRRIPSADPRVEKWQETAPSCCHIVPVLGYGPFDTQMIDSCLNGLRAIGSYAAPGFMNPEGIVVFHTAGNVGFKKTLKNDEIPKTLQP